MPGILEVIVTTVEEAREAEAGGADRLELVRALCSGGLTPDLCLVRDVVRTVSVPVRVMVRETASMTIRDGAEMEALRNQASEIARLPVDGLVAGFVRRGEIDEDAMRQLLEPVPRLGVTFHRAFDEVENPLRAIEQLKGIRQVDHILTAGGQGEWPHRKVRLREWQQAASPEIAIIVAAGLCPSILEDLNGEPQSFQFHVGRAARAGHSISSAVDRRQVASLKSLIR
ncbi:MAG TPA: copper homeostasis protein CutC [Bryobacteraceae bacterium]|jgi:copper homeostasis protein